MKTHNIHKISDWLNIKGYNYSLNFDVTRKRVLTDKIQLISYKRYLECTLVQ